MLSDNNSNVKSAERPISDYKVDEIVKDHILPYSFNPKQVEEESVFLCLSYSKAGKDFGNPSLKNYSFSIKIFCHKNLIEIDGGLRTLSIAHEIDLMLNEVYLKSVGRVKFNVMEELENSNGHYYGYQLFYSIGDFN